MRHYTSYMPMGRDRKIVHIKANDEMASYRFISFEQLSSGVSFCFPVKDRDDIIVITLESLTKENIMSELAILNGCEPKDIGIRVVQGVRRRGREIPDSREYGDSSRWEQVGMREVPDPLNEVPDRLMHFPPKQ